MTMNRKQRIVVWVGAILAQIACILIPLLFPPEYQMGQEGTDMAGFWFFTILCSWFLIGVAGWGLFYLLRTKPDYRDDISGSWRLRDWEGEHQEPEQHE